MKMNKSIQNYLYFTQRERHGALALFLICICLFAFPSVYLWLKPEQKSDFSVMKADAQRFSQSLPEAQSNSPVLFEFDPNTLDESGFVRLGLPEKLAKTICHYRKKGGKFRKPEDFKKIWGLPPEDYERLSPFIAFEGDREQNEHTSDRSRSVPPENFAFDPNTATEADFKRLGLSEKTTQSILNYRSKGGKFRTAADFKKIYTLPEADYLRLEPYIQIAATANAFSGQYQQASAARKPVEINGSSAEDWMLLPGIGEKRARSIVNFREKLGGFLSIEQVGETFSLPDSVFQKIKNSLLLNASSIHKLPVNAASVEQLDAHPYISMKQAIAIVRYREQHGAFSKIEDFEQIVALQADKAWLKKIQPYLGF